MGYPTNETKLVEAITKAVKAAYPASWIFKVHGDPYQKSGIPDLLICVDGVLIGCEVKHQKPGESEAHARDRATPGQRNQIRLISKSGGLGGVVITVDEALDLIARALRKHETDRELNQLAHYNDTKKESSVNG